MANLDRLTAAVSEHASNVQRLLDLAKADADAAVAHVQTQAKVDELSAYIEQATEAVKATLAARNFSQSNETPNG